MNIHKFDSAELQRVLEQLVPSNSPHYIKVQNLIVNLLDINPNFYLQISEHASLDTQVLIPSECEVIAGTVIKEKNIENWAVTYMLVWFY
tara:strand:- start:370 stop:639 length:270 start_codon:yes stop_codon:yes gene_type:complete